MATLPEWNLRQENLSRHDLDQGPAARDPSAEREKTRASTMSSSSSIRPVPDRHESTSPGFGITLSPLVGSWWIQADNGQETRLPADKKESKIESIPNAGIT
jgi:hypothetical protein